MRLFTDDIARISTIKSTDYAKMTVGDYLRFGPVANYKATAMVFTDAYPGGVRPFLEGYTTRLILPTDEAWEKWTNVMQPYHQYAQTMKGADIQYLTSPSQDLSAVAFNESQNPEAQLGVHLLDIANRAQPQQIVHTQQVLNGEVVEVNEVPTEICLNEKVFTDWMSGRNVMNFASTRQDTTAADGTHFTNFIPTGDRQKPTVFLNLPQPLSTTYNFYCVVVPENNVYATTSVAKPTPMNFQLTYCDARATFKTYNFSRKFVTTGNSADQNPAKQDLNNTAFINDTTKVDTLFLGSFTFPVAYDGFSRACPVMKITSPVNVILNKQLEENSRTFRLAAIIMRPVELEENKQQ